MDILYKIAWRNIWRNPRRSGVLLTAIAVGVFCFIGSVAFMDGFSIQMIDSAIDMQGGHIQLSSEGYHENPTIRSYIEDTSRIETVLAQTDGIAAAPVISSPGMANSSEQAAGVVIQGVDPIREAEVTIISRAVTQGRYLDLEGDPNEVLIGEGLANRLNVRLGEKLVLMANDLNNDVSAGAYRVVGLFRTSSTEFDKANVYLRLQDARDLIGYTDQLTSYAVRIQRGTDEEKTITALRDALQGHGLEVLSWQDRFPILVMAMEAYDYSVILLVVILFTAVAFTIINSFLMVIFERIHEIGIMMANGVRPQKIRLMLYYEAFYMVLLGTAIGIVISVLVLGYWMVAGMDLSNFAQGLGAWGVSPVVYPHLDWRHLTMGFGLIMVMVMLAVLYPAYKASRFEPVEAINYV